MRWVVGVLTALLVTSNAAWLLLSLPRDGHDPEPRSTAPSGEPEDLRAEVARLRAELDRRPPASPAPRPRAAAPLDDGNAVPTTTAGPAAPARGPEVPRTGPAVRAATAARGDRGTPRLESPNAGAVCRRPAGSRESARCFPSPSV